MTHKVLLTLIIVAFLPFHSVDAQDGSPNTVLTETPIQRQLLPYTNPMLVSDTSEISRPDVPALELDDLQKQILSRIADIYRIHVLSIDAQVNDDPVSAESYINKALSSIQSLMDQYPEVQNERRFNELYRSVMAEYQEFYGIPDSASEVKGDVFAVRQEMFSEQNDMDVASYNIPDNLSFNKTKVPLVQNRQVSRHLMYYTLKRPEVMERWLERSEKYFPMMRRIFKEEGLPEELIHLSMIESGMVPVARSHAAAVGLWQFIRATGSMYGLEVNWWIDERRDPEKATRAAARHLKDLHNIWGNWYLAMANYNVSPMRLKRAIRAAGKKDYWKASPYLPRETRGYVPGFIAATMIAMNPKQFGFKKDYGVKPMQYDVVRVDGLMPLDKLAKAAGISLEKLKNYNPELLRWATPPGGKYPLKIPKGIKEDFLAAYKQIPKEDRYDKIAMHVVKRGETLGEIARKYGTSVRSLFETNEDLSSMIYPGQKIVVPLPPGSFSQISANHPTNQPRGSVGRTRRRRVNAPSNSSRLYYTVKSGDTIGHIAEWYDTDAWKIRSWNHTGNVIRVGQKLAVYVPKSKVGYYRQINSLSFARKQQIEKEQRAGKKVTTRRFASADNGETVTYRVRRNDTLIDIANSFNVSVGAIKQINNLRSDRIYVGQKLKIRKPE